MVQLRALQKAMRVEVLFHLCDTTNTAFVNLVDGWYETGDNAESNPIAIKVLDGFRKDIAAIPTQQESGWGFLANGSDEYATTRATYIVATEIVVGVLSAIAEKSHCIVELCQQFLNLIVAPPSIVRKMPNLDDLFVSLRDPLIYSCVNGLQQGISADMVDFIAMVTTCGSANQLINVSSGKDLKASWETFSKSVVPVLSILQTYALKDEPRIQIGNFDLAFMHVICAPKLAALCSVLDLAVDGNACDRASKYAKNLEAFDVCSSDLKSLFSAASFYDKSTKEVSACLANLGSTLEATKAELSAAVMHEFTDSVNSTFELLLEEKAKNVFSALMEAEEEVPDKVLQDVRTRNSFGYYSSAQVN